MGRAFFRKLVKRLGTLHWRHFIIQMYVMKLEFEQTIMFEGLFQVPLDTATDSCIWVTWLFQGQRGTNIESCIWVTWLFQGPLGTVTDNCVWGHMSVSGTAMYSH